MSLPLEWKVEDADVYHRAEGMSSHALKEMRRSPAHYHAKYMLGEKSEPTPAMKLGTLLHAAVLEPATFKTKFRTPPKVDRRTQEGKAVYAAFETSLKPEDIVVTDDEVVIMRGVGEAIARHPMARGLLSNGIAERSGYFNHPMGVRGKFRADYLHDDGFIVDLKFVYDASYREFQRSCGKYGYAIQAAWYVDALMNMAGINRDVDFLFIAIEKTAPFAIAVYNASLAFIEVGRRQYQAALREYIKCKEMNTWPGYPTEVQPLDLPRWAEF